MALTESTVRVELFKEIYDIINENKIGGWKVLASFPETSSTFPCIVINPSTVLNEGITVTRGTRTTNFEIEIGLFSQAKQGFKAVEECRDNILSIFRDSTNITNLFNSNIDIKDIVDLGSDQESFDGLKLNTAILRIVGACLL